MTEQKVEFVHTKEEVLERLKQKAPEFRALFASSLWEEWLAFDVALKDSLREVAIRDADREVREEARIQLLALEKFERIPFLLAQLTQEG